MADGNTELPPDARSETTRVRQGKTLGVMRWVLLISTILAVVGLALAYLATPKP